MAVGIFLDRFDGMSNILIFLLMLFFLFLEKGLRLAIGGVVVGLIILFRSASLALDVAEKVPKSSDMYLVSLLKDLCSKMLLLSSLRILWKSYMLSCRTKEEKLLCLK